MKKINLPGFTAEELNSNIGLSYRNSKDFSETYDLQHSVIPQMPRTFGRCYDRCRKNHDWDTCVLYCAIFD